MGVIGGNHGLSPRLICGRGWWEGVCISWCLGGFVERYVGDRRQRDGEKFDEAFHQKKTASKTEQRNNRNEIIDSTQNLNKCGVSENMCSGSGLQLGVRK